LAEAEEFIIKWSLRNEAKCKCIDVSEDGSFLATGSDKGEVFFFDQHGELIWMNETGGKIPKVQVSANGKRVLVNVDKMIGGEIVYYDGNGNILWKKKKMTSAFSDVAMSSQGNYISTVASGFGLEENVQNLIVFGFATWKKIKGEEDVKINPNHLRTDIITSYLELYDRDGGQLWNYESKKFKFTTVSLSRNASFVVTGTDDKKVILFDKDRKFLWSYRVDEKISAISVSPDGSCIAVAANSYKKGKIYFLNHKGRLRNKQEINGTINAVSLTPDGNYALLAISSNDSDYKGECLLISTSGKHIFSYETKEECLDVSIVNNYSVLVALTKDVIVYINVVPKQVERKELNISDIQVLGISGFILLVLGFLAAIIYKRKKTV
jgi:WD40 repeat protein